MAADEKNLSRRDLIKKSVVAGGIAWVAPTVLASPAFAANNCNCADNAFFALKRNNLNGGSVSDCESPGTNVAPGNCGASAGLSNFRSGCCLATAGLVSFSGGGSTHTWVLRQGVRLCQAFGKFGNECSSTTGVTVTNNADGTTTVVISGPTLSHSEIYVCVDGTTIPAICG
jgi:hypothetical protein